MTNCVNSCRASPSRPTAAFLNPRTMVPKQAYTMGIGTIRPAKSVLLSVSGADKAETLTKVIAGR